KTAFVRQMIGALSLSNLNAVHGRVESLVPMEADAVISRAFASLLDFAVLAGRHVRQGGWLVAMKGREPLEEMESLHAAAAWHVVQIQSLCVPELDAQRWLLSISRQKS